ncbi:MAG: exonuclease domain-containing protein [Bacteroidales bacterium]|jgi:DNA polymerase-3 subunit epsilon|nr:exonuclease domain-containing protein [Bacteroidales bacterium]MDD3527343.1 exonuclease domain-containing protein [Bacteroidales bacterium]MDY0336026.1 exonuclease domain-containing protein [Bacteroidales bacterium]NLO52035.1 GIY-YIG nuclease family protein [Bacteroidales bacterium]
MSNTTSGQRFAIVDIETTGTSYKSGKITEVAIIIHDGRGIVDEFTTLINPEQKIDYRIQQLTGISDRMVAEAPKFYEVARQIVEITEDCIFVAHNVSFDYNFIRQEFMSLGYDYQREKLCTVKLSRKLIPFHKSYSLGNICADLNIENPHRHRAYGDARATTTLFEMLLSIDPNLTGLPLQGLSSSLKPEVIRALPEACGVYYFLDDEHNIIYVGKSKNIHSRVLSHLSNCTTKRALEMKNKVAHIDYELTGNELIALLLESHEIQRHLPVYNRAQRRTMFNFGLFSHLDDDGYLNLKLCKLDDCDGQAPLTTFNSMQAGKNFLFQLCEDYQLCQKLCHLYHTHGSCFQYKIKECHGACIGEESPDHYNARVQQVIERYEYSQPSFLLLGDGRTSEECSVVWVEQGRYHGFGFAPRDINGYDQIGYLKEAVKPYTENKYVHSILRSHLEKCPARSIIPLSDNERM